ncbi:MAG TPA: carbohydrate porin [Urbifossiella sp.]|nr:carbohydrate porin [Urbifossiella sp.]
MRTRHTLGYVVSIGLLLGGGAGARAQDSGAQDPAAEPPPRAPEPAAPNPYAGDLHTRLRMTGDWGGTRSALADRGVTFDLFATQFYQGVAAGGREQEFNYGGKLDYLFAVDGGKLGFWPGGVLNFHAETRYGQSVNNVDGLIAPSNLPLSFPDPDKSITSITGFKLTQTLSEDLVVFLGKINTLDEYGFRYAPALGTNRPGLAGFMNTSLVFNPIVARTLPYSAAGVGGAYLRDGEPLLAFTVFDPEERATKGLENLYARGVVLVPDLTVDVKPLGLPGRYNLGGTWSSASYRSFDPAAYLNLPAQLVRDEAAAPKVTGSWSLYANFYQSLRVDEADEKRHWGAFGQFGLSDGNPNPVRFIANGGIGGQSLLPGRKYDTFGVGYFYFGMSSDFKALAQPLLPQRDEFGVELFYNVAITPWARLTGDLQVARPSTVGFDTVILPGLRFQLLF